MNKMQRRVSTFHTSGAWLFSLYVGKQIRWLRKNLNLSGKELGFRVNLSQQQISRYERGVNVLDVEMLFILLNELEYPFDLFIQDVAVEMKKNQPAVFAKYENLLVCPESLEFIHGYFKSSVKEVC
ncbi:helix-turn-helix domain-containing protein [Providencia alcalifaciens]|uniref:helix-turn-helix domain-containing protein n=1 Tax=Providencia alcalifaciens TaxID=126385 RepID=UPI003D9767F6